MKEKKINLFLLAGFFLLVGFFAGYLIATSANSIGDAKRVINNNQEKNFLVLSDDYIRGVSFIINDLILNDVLKDESEIEYYTNSLMASKGFVLEDNSHLGSNTVYFSNPETGEVLSFCFSNRNIDFIEDPIHNNCDGWCRGINTENQPGCKILSGCKVGCECNFTEECTNTSGFCKAAK